MSTIVDIDTLRINYLTQAQYDALISGGTVEEDEIYLTPSSGSGVSDYVIATGVDGIWEYRKWASGTYDAWYRGNINLLAGSAWGSGFYYHQSSSALTPPSFSQSVTALSGAQIAGGLAMFCGVGNGNTTYWVNAASGTGTILVRLDMHGTWQ